MFEPFDVVLNYDRGRGIRVKKGGAAFSSLSRGVRYASKEPTGRKLPKPVRCDRHASTSRQHVAPRPSPRARAAESFLARQPVSDRASTMTGQRRPSPLECRRGRRLRAVRGAARRRASGRRREHSQVLIQLLDWASDPESLERLRLDGAVSPTRLATCIARWWRVPYNAKLSIDLPTASRAASSSSSDLVARRARFREACVSSPPKALSSKLLGPLASQRAQRSSCERCATTSRSSRTALSRSCARS